jgi:large subunit ribosomal protein L32
MAVPKKRTSKSKKNARKANWKRKGYKAAQKSLSLAKSMLRGKTTSFVYSIYTLMKNKSLNLFKDLFLNLILNINF